MGDMIGVFTAGECCIVLWAMYDHFYWAVPEMCIHFLLQQRSTVRCVM